MHKKRINRKYLFTVMFLMLSSGLFCGCSSKKKEIVWYISEPESYGIENAVAYEEIEAECFQLFNERLEELKIPAKVVFKYMPDKYEAKQEDFESGNLYESEFLFQTKMIENLLEKDADADIAGFSSLEYEKFLALDEYLKEEENKKVLNAIPETVWKANTINQKTYQIPRGNVSIFQLTYVFYKPFLEKYQINLDETGIENMTPEDVIRFLKPYFEEEQLLDGKYYLTSATDLQYGAYLQKRYIPVIKNSRDCNLAVDVQEKKVASLLDTPEMEKMLEIHDLIYKENLDAHIERQYQNGVPVFRMTSIPTIKELTGETEKEWVELPLGDRTVESSFGNGVLKDSDEKELAVRVLAASMYDEELTNIMIYGVLDKEYQLTDGHAIYQGEGTPLSSMGSFKRIGNNRIAYPNQLEVKEKAQITEQLLEETIIQEYGNFTPVLDENLSKKIAEIAEIYNDMESKTEFEEIPDFEVFIQEQEQKLREAGVTEVISELQKQLDSWKE